MKQPMPWSPAPATHRILGHCPCCEGVARQRWFHNTDLVLHRCSRCGVIYQDPQPVLPALLRLAYDEHYFDVTKRSLSSQVKAFAPRLVELAKLLSRPGDTPIRALDVGSGMGAFLLAAQQRGWDPTGLEPSPYAVDFCVRNLGVRVILGTLDTNIPFPKTFDVIHLHHSLEHFQCPLPNLQRVRSLLNPGGVLVIEVPREGKWASLFLHALSVWGGRIATRYPRSPFLTGHLCIFTTRSLRALLRRSDFTIDHLWVEGQAASPAHFDARFGDSPPLGKLLGRASLLFRADVLAGLGNIVAYARSR